MCDKCRMVGMSNIPTWVSAGAATLSFIFTVVSWYLSNKSKEAKAKADEAHKAALAMSAAAERSAKAAEERADQAEKLLEQMQQIADSLRGPVLESSIKILEALNHKYFYYSVYSKELAEIPKEVHPGKPIDLPLPHTASVRSLDLRIKVNGEEKILYVEIPR